VQENVKGTNSRISQLLKANFDCVDGRGNTKLWLLSTSATTSADDAPTRSGANSHD
jgi:hypothetical protein